MPLPMKSGVPSTRRLRHLPSPKTPVALYQHTGETSDKWTTSFIQDTQQKERIYWRCLSRDCRPRLCTTNGRIVKGTMPRNHPPVAGQEAVEIILSAMKERAAATAEPVSHTVDTFYAQVDAVWAHLLPAVNGVKRTLRRQRKRSCVKDLTPFRSIVSGDAFLRHEGGMLIFASGGGLRFLAEARHWFGNGTFKVTPVGFKQQYNIHAYFDGVTSLCLCFAAWKK